jgi:hypothetical protein
LQKKLEKTLGLAMSPEERKKVSPNQANLSSKEKRSSEKENRNPQKKEDEKRVVGEGEDVCLQLRSSRDKQGRN